MKLFVPIVLALLMTACGPTRGSEEMDQVIAERILTRQAVAENDDLKSVINELEEQLARLKAIEDSTAALEPGVRETSFPDSRSLSNEEVEIRQLIKDMHTGWENGFKKKEPDQVLQYFLDEYTTNSVTLDTNNEANARRFTQENFREHLNEVFSIEGVEVDFGDVKFLYTETKDSYFTITYRCRYRVYLNNAHIRTTSLISTVAGKKKGDGTYGVGSYSWVNMNYAR